MATIGNILTGAVSIYQKAYVDDSTDNPISGNTVDWTGWTQFGFLTEDGVSVEYEPEFLDISVQEYNAIVKKVLTGESLTVNFSLQESDLAQMVYAMTGGTYTAGATPGTNPNTLTLGDGTVTNLALGFEGTAATGNEFVAYFRKVVAMGTVGVPYTKGQVRVVPLSFQCLADTTVADGKTMAELTEITSA